MDIAIPVLRLTHSGGMQHYTWHVGHELACKGHRVTFFVPASTYSDTPFGTRVLTVGWRKHGHALGGLGEFLSFGPRATVHAMLRDPTAIRYGPLGCLLGPGVVTAHSVHAAWVRQRQRRTGQRANAFDRAVMALERATYALSSLRVTTVSPDAASELEEFYSVPRDRIRVVPPGVDGSEFPVREPLAVPAARERLGIPGDSYVVGTVANYSFDYKGVADLIKACGRAGATLLVAGTDDSALARHRALAAELGADVRFLGLTSDITSFYQALDVFVLASMKESYGMSAHEAMATGVPTIVTSECGIASLFQRNQHALVIPHGAVEQLSEAVDALRDREMALRLATSGASWAHSRSWSAVATDIEDELTYVQPRRTRTVPQMLRTRSRRPRMP